MAAPSSTMWPWARCAAAYAHLGHTWLCEGAGLRSTYWCRGRAPVTVGEAAAGAARLAGHRDVDLFVALCRSTAAGREYLVSTEWQALRDALVAGEPPRWRPPLAVRLFAPWFWVVKRVGPRWVSGDPELGAWWRYVLSEPVDAAYSLPRLAACRWLGRHGVVCAGKRDQVHLAWRRKLIEGRRP